MNTINQYDLQFGLLALRMFFVGGDQLVTAINEWENRQDVSLSKVLIELGVMGADECELIESMLPAREALAAESLPEKATAVELPTEATLSNSGDLTLSKSSPSASDLPSAVDVDHGRFHTLKSHAKGALGEVFVARDKDLRRDVALKQMLDHCAMDANNRARFIFEAEVTGSLEHPGIVPIYALGRQPDGRPFYAMRFIEGSTMEDAIDMFHADGGVAGNPIAPLMLRELLGQMIDICNTMAYAHSRGVVHRDLKPANVMLGRYGETLVVDWGLAKIVGQTGTSPESASSKETALDDDPEFEETRLGEACGTPQYMSPEQSMGRHDLVDARSDIYSLGATLYKLLTGQVAFSGTRLADVLEAVRSGTFTRPRQLVAAIPKPLEAICLKAMSLDPSDRYDSAILLANDLSNWMADQPVGAYSEPVGVRLRRWTRRHRSIVGTASLAAFAIMLVLVASVAMLTKAYQTAERNRKQARGAVDQFFTTVSEDTLLKQPGMENLRTELLDLALRYYRGFLQDEGGDGLQREIGLTRYYVGRIVEEVESPAEAAVFYRNAEVLQRTLLRNEADDELAAELASTLNALGRTYDKQSEQQKALDLLKESLAIRQSLAEGHSENTEYQRNFANALMNIGLVLQSKQSYSEAIEFLQRAQEIRVREKADANADVQIMRDLAKGYYNLAAIRYEQNQLTEAKEQFVLAFKAFEELVAKNPDDLDDVYRLGIVSQMLGDIEADTVGFATAQPTYLKAADTYEKLVYKIPGVPEYQYALASLLITMGEQQAIPENKSTLSRAQSILSSLQSHATADPKFDLDMEYIQELLNEISTPESAQQ